MDNGCILVGLVLLLCRVSGELGWVLMSSVGVDILHRRWRWLCSSVCRIILFVYVFSLVGWLDDWLVGVVVIALI